MAGTPTSEQNEQTNRNGRSLTGDEDESGKHDNRVEREQLHSAEKRLRKEEGKITAVAVTVYATPVVAGSFLCRRKPQRFIRGPLN